MPRKKRTIVEETLPDNPSSILTTDEGESVLMDSELPLDEVFNSFGEQPFLMKVYKITPTGSSFVFSSTEKPSAATFESSIQDRCPSGGKFVIRFYVNNRIVEPSRHVEIEPRPMNALVNSGATDARDVQIRMMQDNLVMFQQMLMAFIGRPAPVTQQTPMNDLVQAMTVMHGLNGNKSSDVDVLIKGIELAKGLNGNGVAADWKSELLSTAREVLAPVAGAFAQQKMMQADPQQRAITEGSVNGNGMNRGMIPNMLIKQGLSWLKPKILSGNFPVEIAVDWILTNGNDAMYQPFLAMAVQGNIDTFIQIDPELANEPYKSWMITAINMLKGAYANNNQADNDGGIGDNTDITSNEIVSAGVAPLGKAV